MVKVTTGFDSNGCEILSGEMADVNGSKPEVGDDKFTKCGLCGEMFTQPRMLSCLHTFCLRCLEDSSVLTTTTHRTTAHSQTITCPRCRQEFPLPVGGLDRLPVNIFFGRLAERRRTSSNASDMNDSLRQVNLQWRLYTVQFSYSIYVWHSQSINLLRTKGLYGHLHFYDKNYDGCANA